MKGRVLVVDDDPSLGEMLGIVLRQEGFEPVFVRSGDQAIAAFHQAKPDLVLLDLMLPGKDGIDVCKEIRAESGVPIVMLTAKSDTVDVVLGLESGADDYVVKPFKPKELVARIRARVRRTETEPAEQLAIGDVSIDVPAHQVERGGKPIALTPLEFDLLVALARKPRQGFTREVLLESVLVRGNEARITFREHAVPRMKGISAAFHEVQFQAEVRRAHPLSLKLTRLGGAELLTGLVRALATLRAQLSSGTQPTKTK